MSSWKIFAAVMACLFSVGPGAAQHGAPAAQDEDAVAAISPQPYGVESFGAFRKLMMEGDFSPKLVLGHVIRTGATVGVGAVADALGEITIIDTIPVVSYGKPGEHPPAVTERAALLVISSATEWQKVSIDAEVAPTDLERFLAEAAGAHGIDVGKSFPFQVRGALISYEMHTNAVPSKGPHGMGQPMAIMLVQKGDEIPGEVAGIYVAPALVGIATLPGERTHSHWLSPDRQSTAHLDHWGIKAGATLLLPKP